MKRLFILCLSAGPVLTGCQLPNPFSRTSSADLRSGQTSTASDSRFNLFANDEPAPEVLLQQAEQAWSSQDFDTAADLYEQVLAQEPENVTAHHRLAIILDNKGEFMSAEPHYRAALNASPSDANIIGDLGYSYLLQGRLSEAEPYLLRARSLDPTLPQVVMNLGILYARQGDWARSEQMFAQVLPPDQVQAEMLKHGMPLPSGVDPNASSASRIASGQLQTPEVPADASPETLALMQQLEQARLHDAQQRALREQERQMQEQFERQQAAAAGYPTDPEGQRLRSQMDQIDQSTLPDNSRTIVLGPTSTQEPAAQPQAQGMYGAPITGQSQSTQWPAQPPQASWNDGLPVSPASQQTQTPAQVATDMTSHGQVSNTGEFQAAPVYRGLPGGQGANPQYTAQSQQQPPGDIQQVGAQPTQQVLVEQAYAWGQQGVSEQAHYEGGQQWQGGTQSNVTQASDFTMQQTEAVPQAALIGDVNAFDDAARSAAIMGLGVGGGPMFPIATPLTPQVSPGSGSMINGGMYPEVERQLPTDRLMDMNQSFQFQQDGLMQSQAHEFRPAPNSLGQTMPSVMTQSQNPATSGMPASPWQSSVGTGASAVPVNPLAEYDQARAAHDAQTQQMLQETQGMTPSHYMVAPRSEVNPHIPVVTGSQLMLNAPTNQPAYGMQSSTGQSQSQPAAQSPSSPYYPGGGQLAPSPWDSVPRIDPSAAQSGSSSSGSSNGVVTPPPYNPQGGSYSTSGATGTAQPTSSGYTPSQGPLIRPAR